MANFHNTPDGPAPCRARQGRCPFGKDGADHYSNQADAQKAYDSTMASKYGNTNSHSRKSSKPRPSTPRHTSMSPALRKHLRPASSSSTTAPFTRPPKSASRTSPIGKFAKKGARLVQDNHKTILMTKYWVPDPHSDAWKN